METLQLKTKRILLQFLEINFFIMEKIEIILIIKINTVLNLEKAAQQILKNVVY